jgi:hypothetical protein
MSETEWIEKVNPETGNNTYINPKFLASVESAETISEVNTEIAHIPTAEEIAAVEAQLLKDKAKQYLIDTDWYASRKAEADIAIPADILALRQQARLDASS